MKLLLLLLTAALASAADFTPLFNGQDLSGWQMTGPGRFVVEDGAMKTEGGMGLLYYAREKFGNCTIRVVFKTTGAGDNSGVIIRLPEPPPDPWYAVHNGYEVQIGGQNTGTLYSLTKAMAQPSKPPGEWSTMDILLDGQTTIVILNGVKVTEFRGDQPVPPRKAWHEPVRGPRPDEGYIGLQNHDERSTVYFREVSVKRNSPGAATTGGRASARTGL
jgi:hypothetical protein